MYYSYSLFIVQCYRLMMLYIAKTCTWFAHKIKQCLDYDPASFLFSLYMSHDTAVHPFGNLPHTDVHSHQ